MVHLLYAQPDVKELIWKLPNFLTDKQTDAKRKLQNESNHCHQLERTLDVLLTRRYNRVTISINSLISVNKDGF